MAEDFSLQGGVEFDDAQANQEFTRLAAVFERAFTKAAPNIGRQLANEFQREFGRINVAKNLFDPLKDSAEEAAQGSRQAKEAADDLGDAFRKAGQEGSRFYEPLADRITRLNEDQIAFEKRVEATRKTLRAAGADENLFAVLDRQLQIARSVFRDFEEEVNRPGTLGAERFEALERILIQTNATAQRELGGLQSNLRSFTVAQNNAAQAAAKAADRAAQGRLQESKQLYGREITELQAFNARALQEQRQAGRESLVLTRAAAARRVEVLRFAFRQIQTLERGLAGLFRATGTVLRGTVRGISAATSRMGSLFRRSNRELNDGLNAALIQREQSLGRSFRRQTGEISTAVAQQSAIIDRFERQTSSGIIGAATGRSRLGGLVGGGVAFGGGFLLARQLRQGFEETVNLNESLNKTRQIFQDASNDIIEFSEDSVDALFVTQSQALEAASNFGIFGKAAGLTGQELSTFSKDLSVLATDLASFNNTSIADATTAISAALRGESEPIRRYGVLLNEAVLQQRAYSEGITETIRKLEPFERVLAANAEIFAQTVDQQGDAARTADDFANSSRRAGAAVTTLFAAITANLIPVAEAILRRALPAIQALTDFIEGDVSPALLTFRNALVGAAAGLAALLIAKTVAESIGLLGTALRGVVRPMGLIVTAFALAGAGIAILAQRSERFSAFLQGLISTLQDFAGRGLGLARRGLQALGDVIRTRVLPVIADLAETVGGVLVTGLAIAIGFIIDVAIPAFRRLAELIADNIVPALRLIGDFLTGTVVPALQRFADVAVTVLSSVIRFLGPAIDGFARLGGAIVDAFQTGDLSGLLGGLQAVAVGIGTVFANLGVLIYEALRPRVERAIQFLSNAFDRIDFAKIGLQILEIVRLIGFVLGSIVSDPKFILALEAIVAAAAAVAVKFVQGFVQGVISNLPGLANLLGGQLRTLLTEAFRFAVSNPEVIGALILAGFAAKAILAAWTRAGQAGAAGLARGFATGLRSAPISAAQFVDGFFGGPGRVEAALRRNAQRQARTYNRAFDRALRDFARLGQTPTSFVAGDATARDVQAIQNELKTLRGDMGEARAAGRLFQQNLSENFRGVANIAQGSFRTITRSANREVGQVRLGFQQVTTAIGDSFLRLRDQGRLSGQALGGAVLAGFGAVISGQQLGGGNTLIGLSGILASAITAGVSTGSAAVGVAVAGIGLLTSVIEGNKRAAEEAAAAIDTYAQAIINAGGAAEATSQVAKLVTDAFTDLPIETQEAFAAFDLGGFVDKIRAGIDPTQAAFIGLTDSLGLTAREAADLGGALNDALSTNFADRTLGLRELDELLKDTGISAEQFLDAYGAFAEEGGNFEQGIRESVVALSLLESAQRGASDALSDPDVGRRAAAQFEQIVGSATQAYDETGSLIERGADAAAAAIGYIGDTLGGLEATGRDSLRWVTDYISGITRAFAATDIFASGFDEAGQPLNQAAADMVAASVAANGLGDDLDGLGDDLEDLPPQIDLVSEAIQDLNRQRTERVRAEIDAIRDRLDVARDAADRAREALTDFITGRYADTAQARVDDLIGNIGNIGSEIEDALLQGGVRGEAALRSAVGGFESQLAGIIQAGFDDGLRTQEEFANLLAPLFAAVNEETGDAARRILSNVDFTEGITPQAGSEITAALQRALTGNELEVRAGAIMNAQAEVEAIQRQLDSLEATLDVDVVFSADQIQQALLAAGLNPDILNQMIAAGVFQGVTATQTPGIAGSVAQVNSGQALPTGVTSSETTVYAPITVTGASEPVITAGKVVGKLNAAVAGVPLPAGVQTPGGFL